ncbi:response regulator [Actimicrobium antarcticum]|uniref:Chemotaxis protein CheY n=1 Tax=Actimicrobium antarcticum TaxID=1051899 RepID=A0ABP7SPJ7_9BURK
MKVVIIDDNEMTRMLLRTTFVAAGHEVAGEASNATNGYEQAIRLVPDLVCLDIVLPDGSGIDVLKQIKSAHPKMIVLMVSGERGATTIKECLASGASGFILKPFNQATVLNSVNDAVMRLLLVP